MNGISIGHPYPRHCSGRKTLRRCGNNEETDDDVIMIDVDSGQFDNIIIIDVPECSSKNLRGSSMTTKDEKGSFSNVIYIDDDEIPDNNHSGKASTRNQYGLNSDSESDSSDNDYHDFELIEDSSGKVQWEKAFFNKRKDSQNGDFGIRDDDSTSDGINRNYLNCELGISSRQIEERLKHPASSNSAHQEQSIKEPPPKSDSSVDKNEDKDYQLYSQNGDALPPEESSIINEREKLKKTDEYRRAIEEEWASRKKALQIQAEEAQHQRQLLKRRKAEKMRLLDMQRRQKQRVEDIRNAQKKDEEHTHLKEVIRAEARKELKKLENSCHNMASMLHSLGIRVDGWPNPSPQEVQTAYKRALLTFHPDRALRSDIYQQVAAEEKFKLINRLKDKFSPSF